MVPKVIVKFLVATVTPPRRWGWRTAKRGGEPQTVWWGFRQSCAAGTGENLTFFTGKKVTFFTGERSWTGGLGMETGFRGGRSHTGGTLGTSGTEDITGFNLSTDTESDLSSIWITKYFSECQEHNKVLCREEKAEVLMRHLYQTQTQHPSEL